MTPEPEAVVPKPVDDVDEVVVAVGAAIVFRETSSSISVTPVCIDLPEWEAKGAAATPLESTAVASVVTEVPGATVAAALAAEDGVPPAPSDLAAAPASATEVLDPPAAALSSSPESGEMNAAPDASAVSAAPAATPATPPDAPKSPAAPAEPPAAAPALSGWATPPISLRMQVGQELTSV